MNNLTPKHSKKANILYIVIPIIIFVAVSILIFLINTNSYNGTPRGNCFPGTYEVWDGGMPNGPECLTQHQIEQRNPGEGKSLAAPPRN